MSKVSIDHLGNEFSSLTEMCEYYKISRYTLRIRLKLGWSLEKTLTTPVQHKGDSSFPCKDYDGNEYSSFDVMCKHYGLNKTLVRSRLGNGWSLKDALTVSNDLYNGSIDHKGIEYASFNAMCRHYEISPYSVRNRLRLGWSLEKALMTAERSNYKSCEDHLGNRFETFSAMCDFHNINECTVLYRLKRGADLGTALSTTTDNALVGNMDHLGNVYASARDMCDNYNLSYELVKCRVQRGWSLEKSLTTPRHKRGKTKLCKDHLGNEFSSINAMCEHYGLDKCTFYRRLRIGWSMERALTTKVLSK